MPGFLGTRASLMLDVVFLAMFLVLPVLGYSIYQVKVHRRYALHKRIQLVLGAVLLATVAVFEVDLRLYTDWNALASPSPYYSTWVMPSLILHLFFAVPTALLWIFVIVQGLRKIPDPPGPGPYSSRHRRWGWLAAFEMAMTALTGWVFYYLAFVA